MTGLNSGHLAKAIQGSADWFIRLCKFDDEFELFQTLGIHSAGNTVYLNKLSGFSIGVNAGEYLKFSHRSRLDEEKKIAAKPDFFKALVNACG